MKTVYFRSNNIITNEDGEAIEVCKSINAAKRRSRYFQRTGVTVRVMCEAPE